MFFVYCITTFSICKDKNLPVLIFFLWGILPVKGGRIYERKRMDAFRRSWRCAVAVLMMPRQNPVRRVAAKAANKAEDLAWKVEDKMNEVL